MRRVRHGEEFPRRRDLRTAEVVAALAAAGHEPTFAPAVGGNRRVVVRGSKIAATIHADGSVTRTWADGTVSFEGLEPRP